MEVLATMTAHCKKTGAYLGKYEIITGCFECFDLDEFTDEHGGEIAYYLHNQLAPKINADGVIYQLRLVELEDEDGDDLNEEEVINNFRRWL